MDLKENGTLLKGFQRVVVYSFLGILCVVFLRSNVVHGDSSSNPKVSFLDYGIFLDCIINGLEYRFLFDTGATFSLFDFSFKPLLGVPERTVTVEVPTGTKDVEMYKTVDVIFDNMKISTTHPVLMTDLGILKKVSGIDFEGILGMAVLYDKIWDIDFDEKTFVVKKHLDWDPLEKGFISHDIPPTKQGVPSTTVTIAKKTFNFIIDTGDIGFGRLTQEAVEFLRGKELIISEEIDSSVNLTGAVDTRIYTVRGLSIGEKVFNNVRFRESQQNALGLGFLRKHHVIFDFPEKKMFLKQGLGVFHPERVDKSGLKLISHGGQLYVAHVADNSPAAISGIAKSDIVISVDGQAVKGEDLQLVRDVLKGDNAQKVMVDLLRGKKKVSVTLVLKEGYNHI